MKGKLFRRNKDGYIYEVVGLEEPSGMTTRWVLWNDRSGERHKVMDIELERQVGWELVGTAKGAAPPKPTAREIPPALMK